MRNDIVVTKMIDHIEKIQQYTSGMTYETFTDNDMALEACAFNLSQIGELANKVDQEYKEAHPEIPWNKIYGLRNHIVHDYEGVNLSLVWQIINDDLPELKRQLSTLKSEGNI